MWEPKYGDTVKITSGFWRDQIGKVTDFTWTEDGPSYYSVKISDQAWADVALEDMELYEGVIEIA